MSDFKVTFGNDMPSAAVEVLSSDFQVIGRGMLTTGASTTIAVPSPASALRVYLPGGPAITLSDPQSLDQTVTLESILPSLRSEAARRLLAQVKELDESPAIATKSVFDSLKGVVRGMFSAPIPSSSYLPGGRDVTTNHGAKSIKATLTKSSGATAFSLDSNRAPARWIGGPSVEDFSQATLQIEQPDGTHFCVEVPSNFAEVRAQACPSTAGGPPHILVSIRSRSPEASLALNYLSRSELEAADVMTAWATRGRHLLMDKVEDPYGAAVGGYVFLRLKKSDGTQAWSKNLADWFPMMADGCIVHAWELAQNVVPPPIEEIGKYLLQAVSRGRPTYTEGLRLLLQGLQLLGKDGDDARKSVTAALGEILWGSPFTAWVDRTSGAEAGMSPAAVTVYEVVAT